MLRAAIIGKIEKIEEIEEIEEIGTKFLLSKIFYFFDQQN